MNPDTHVYCTHCKNFKVTYTNDVEPFCLNEKVCDFWNFEDSKPFKERPYYQEGTACDYHSILSDNAKTQSDIAEIRTEAGESMIRKEIEKICYGCREMYGDRDDHKCLNCQHNYIHKTFYFDDTKETVKNVNYIEENQ